MSVSGESKQIIGLYQRHAGAWDRARAPGSLFEKPWLDQFLALAPLGGTILDLGCGAGLPIAGYFISQGYGVTGVDTSEPLLALSRSRYPAQEWIAADMRTLDLDRSFAGIIAWDSFFHLTPDDQQAMFPVFARHAGPRAPLMFTSGPQHGSVLGEMEGEPLYHGSLDPEEYRSLLEETGFELVDNVFADPTCAGHAVWLARAA